MRLCYNQSEKIFIFGFNKSDKHVFLISHP